MDLKKKANFLDYKYDKYSQNGEDGIIEEIFKRLNIICQEELWCVEFGAWDGIFLSNTFNLVKKGWKAIYIEGDIKRYKKLQQTAKIYKSIIPIHAYVSHLKKNKNNLDELLSNTDIPIGFDLLSIDIDSFDLEVWFSIQKYDPKVVFIEINSQYLPGIIKWHSKNCSRYYSGNSFSATLKVAKEKGYVLICHCGSNMIFVKKEYINLLNLDEKFLEQPELLFDNNYYILSKQNQIKKFTKRVLNRIKRFLIYKK